MKTKVLLVTALLVGIAASAQAVGIVGTKHDLSRTNSSGTNSVRSSTQNQVCVFCHVPHNSVVAKLLWNRTTNPASMAIYTSYNTKAMRDALTVNGTKITITTGSNSLLCLSCHTLTTAGSVISDTANTKGGTATNAAYVMTGASLGTDLTNDHPIGIDYALAKTTDSTGLVAAFSVNEVDAGKKYRLFAGSMQCATCHSVHDATIPKFLVADNAGSTLCLACHVK